MIFNFRNKKQCKNGCWKIFMLWKADWITTGHNIWTCSRCGQQAWFDNKIKNPNNFNKYEKRK